jgi:hypothetical protein
MLICNYDLYDITAILVQIRYEPKYPLNKQIIDNVVQVLVTPDKDNNFVCNKIRAAVSKIVDLDKEKWWIMYNENVYVHISIIKDRRVYDVLIKALNALGTIIQGGNEIQIDDLVDAIHCLPDIIAENRFSITKSYWKTHIKPYRDKWDGDFLKAEQRRWK